MRVTRKRIRYLEKLIGKTGEENQNNNTLLKRQKELEYNNIKIKDFTKDLPYPCNLQVEKIVNYQINYLFFSKAGKLQMQSLKNFFSKDIHDFLTDKHYIVRQYISTILVQAGIGELISVYIYESREVYNKTWNIRFKVLPLLKNIGERFIKLLLAHIYNDNEPELKTISNQLKEMLENRFDSEEKFLHLGKLALHYFIEQNWISIKSTGHREPFTFSIAELVKQEWFNSLFQFSSIFLRNLPMLVRPRRWTFKRKGGYLTNYFNDLIRHHPRTQKRTEIKDRKLFYAINELQEKAFRINKLLYYALCGLKNKEEYNSIFFPTPSLAKKTIETDTFIEKKGKKRVKKRKRTLQLYNKEKSSNDLKIPIYLSSKTNYIIYEILIAGIFLNEKAIYFPYFLDQRTRFYTTSYFSFYGNDLARALLENAKEVKLSIRGIKDLLSYGGVLFSQKTGKISYEDRIKWAIENRELFSKMVTHEDTSWINAKEPCVFLSWLIELERLDFFSSTDIAASIKNMKNKTTNFIIRLDANASGMQHITALLNISKKDTLEKLNFDIAAENTPINDMYNEMAEECKKDLKEKYPSFLLEKINKKILKSQTMTSFYGATLHRHISELQKDTNLKAQIEKDIMLYKYKEKNAHALLKRLAIDINKYLKTRLETYFLFLNFIKDAVYMKHKEELEITWETLNCDAVIHQSYKKTVEQRIVLTLGKKSFRFKLLKLKKNNDEDLQKALNSTSANIIHSFDASLLREMILFTLRLRKNPVNSFSKRRIILGSIHDCLLTTPGNIHFIKKVYCTTYFKLYNKDLMKTFWYNFLELAFLKEKEKYHVPLISYEKKVVHNITILEQMHSTKTWMKDLAKFENLIT